MCVNLSARSFRGFSVIFLLSVPWLMGLSQQQTPPNGSGPPTTPSSASMAALQTQYSPLDSILLGTADEDEIPTSLFSRISLEYDHGSFSGGAENDRVRVKGQQTFGPITRVSAGYEIPFVDFRAAGDGPSGHGIGDIKVNLNAVLGQTARFKHAATVEFTFPSASNNLVGPGQTIVRPVWGFSTPLGNKTILNGILAYNKAVTARSGQQGLNSFEPEAVLVRQFASRVAGYLDYDTYRDFNVDRFGELLKAGLQIGLNRTSRWGLSPYAQFALNHFTSSTNIKRDIGVELSWRY